MAESSNDAAVDKAVTDIMRGLSYPLRRRILYVMEDEEVRSPTQVASILGEPLGVVAYHIRVLYKYKLLKKNGQRMVRGAKEHFYRPIEGAIPLLQALETIIHDNQPRPR